jgi:hypothetical protein
MAASGHYRTSRRGLPLSAEIQQRTFTGSLNRSALCHKETHAHRSKQGLYSTTLSAIARSAGGTVRPSS